MPAPIVPALVFDTTLNNWTLTDFPQSWPGDATLALPVGQTPLERRKQLLSMVANQLRQSVIRATAMGPTGAMPSGDPAYPLKLLDDGIVKIASAGGFGPTAQIYIGRALSTGVVFLPEDFPSTGPTPSGPLPDARIPRVAQFRADAIANIATLTNTYARPGVPDEHIITRFPHTLKGDIFNEKVQANILTERIWPGSPPPFPEAAGVAEGILYYPVPDGTIDVGSGFVPVGIPSGVGGSYPPPSTWPVGTNSGYQNPPDTYWGPEGKPAPFRHPLPLLYRGPKNGGTDPFVPSADTGVGGPTPAPVGPPAISGPIPVTPSLPTGGPVAVGGPTAGPNLPAGSSTADRPAAFPIMDSVTAGGTPASAGGGIGTGAPMPSLESQEADVKPNNVMLYALGGLLLVGLGIAFTMKGGR